MLRHFDRRARSFERAARGSLALALTMIAGGACLNRPLETLEPRTTLTIFERLNQSTINKIDLVLAIDNSASMADKQDVLARAVPDLVEGLVNPRCVDEAGIPTMDQPAGPLDPCPVAGTEREFAPVVDIHIGIISSSLGGVGSDSCPDVVTTDLCPNKENRTNNDRGHLLSRKNECGGDYVATYSDKGFLAWDPEQKLMPAGTKDIGELSTSLREMVLGVGQTGCGYEAQLESWYRFLVDPEPYETVVLENDLAVPTGLDNALLTQRRDFLRPDSLLAILMLSDENDCSIRVGGTNYVAALRKNKNGGNYHLPAPRSECATDPNDPCCRSCLQDPGTCPKDPSCFDVNGNVRALPDEDDNLNLRCFNQKQRFGFDFLYPIDRYTGALSSTTVPNRAGELVPNPLFTDLDTTDNLSPTREPSMVFLAGIVGVPWQDIAVNKDDLTEGFKTASAMAKADDAGVSTWDIVLGDPAKHVKPLDTYMIESIEPRTGKNPITGDPTTTSCDPGSPINGCEHPAAEDDLQFACVFKLPEPVDCTLVTGSCDCSGLKATKDNPLCAENPNDGGKYTLQVNAKAYPGIRELSALKGAGEQGIVASVCAKQLDNADAEDYGYRPAIGAIIARLKERLRGQCLARSLAADKAGHVPCLIVEATRAEDAQVASCNACDTPGRQRIQSGHESALQSAKDDTACLNGQCNCFCEIKQLEGEDLKACQYDKSAVPVNASSGAPVSGWCYVDATTSPPTGHEDLVKDCASTERRLVRVVGGEEDRQASTLFITCTGDTQSIQ